MSQIVSGNADALAAEYVLGTLDPEERTQAHALLEIDQEFVAKVRLWERRLGELHLMVEPVEPEGKIWDRIKAKMPELQLSPQISPAEPEAQPGPEVPAPGAPAAETPPPPSPNAVPAATSDAHLPPTPTLGPTPTATPALTPAATAAVSPATSSTVTPPTPKPAVAPVLTPGMKRTPDVESKVEPKKRDAAVVQGRLTRWRAFAVLMTLLVLAVAALLAAWRFVPERVPPMLRPAEVMRLMGVTAVGSPPPRKPAPPESQFDE
jgi:anti-sigma-K factor RskA